MKHDFARGVVRRMTPFPDGCDARVIEYAIESAAACMRARQFDEAIWHQCQELGQLMFERDVVTDQLKAQGWVAEKSLVAHPLAQHRSALCNRIDKLRDMLLLTTSARARKTPDTKGQTSFLDDLVQPVDTDPANPEPTNLTPFQRPTSATG